MSGGGTASREMENVTGPALVLITSIKVSSGFTVHFYTHLLPTATPPPPCPLSMHLLHPHSSLFLPSSIPLSHSFFLFPPPLPPRRLVMSPANERSRILKLSAAGTRPAAPISKSSTIKEETSHILSLGPRLLRLRLSMARARISMRKPWRMLAPSEALSHPPFFGCPPFAHAV